MKFRFLAWMPAWEQLPGAAVYPCPPVHCVPPTNSADQRAADPEHCVPDLSCPTLTYPVPQKPFKDLQTVTL